MPRVLPGFLWVRLCFQAFSDLSNKGRFCLRLRRPSVAGWGERPTAGSDEGRTSHIRPTKQFNSAGVGKAATVTLYVNGKKAGEGKIHNQVPFRFGVESMDVGMDTLSPVSKTYEDKLPFAFTGTIEKAVLDFN